MLGREEYYRIQWPLKADKGRLGRPPHGDPGTSQGRGGIRGLVVHMTLDSEAAGLLPTLAVMEYFLGAKGSKSLFTKKKRLGPI